jgi:predicted DNA binding protein
MRCPWVRGVRNVAPNGDSSARSGGHSQRLEGRVDAAGGVSSVSTALLAGTDPETVQSALVTALEDLGLYDAIWVGNRLDSRPTSAVGPEGVVRILGEITTLTDETDGLQTGGDVTVAPVALVSALAADRGVDVSQMRAARVPLRHRGLACGMLAVATDRSDAFGAAERELLAEVGRLAGFALDAVVHRRLLSDRAAIEAVLEARADTTPTAMTGLAAACNGSVELDRVIPRDESAHLYVSVPDTDMSESTLVDGDLIREVRVPDAESGGGTLELVVSDQCPLASLAISGVTVVSAVADTDRLRATVRAGETGPEILRAFRSRFPGVRCVAKRQATERGSARDATELLDRADLTRKQRTVLEAALAGGFFERPRERTGAEIAESLDISASTFHQHLREALRKVVETTLDGCT